MNTILFSILSGLSGMFGWGVADFLPIKLPRTSAIEKLFSILS
ncbi:MAG: hypothetical protein WCJ58_00435 [bacterium]